MASDYCMQAVKAGAAAAGHISAFRTTYLPLSFSCQVPSKGTYEAAVPEYVNPTVFALLAFGFLFAILGGPRRGNPPDLSR